MTICKRLKISGISSNGVINPDFKFVVQIIGGGGQARSTTVNVHSHQENTVEAVFQPVVWGIFSKLITNELIMNIEKYHQIVIHNAIPS